MTALEISAHQPPIKIMQLMHSRWAVQALRSAVELDVFSKLSTMPKSAAKLAAELSLDVNGMEHLLNALSGLGFLNKKDGKYELSDESRMYLSKSSDLYMGWYVTDQRVQEAWSMLNQALKTGKPVNSVNQAEKAEEFFPKLAESIFPMNYGTAHIVAAELKIDQLPSGSRVLDVAAGSGVWSLPMAERNKGIKVDALDFPSVLEVTKRFAAKHGVAERFSYISGNWSDCELEPEAYEIVCLGHILHSEGRQRSIALLKEVHRCLKLGGKVVIAEMISDNERVAAAFPLLFALNMFLLTDEGCVFSEGELHDLLLDLGFKSIERLELPYWGSDSPLMIATK